MPTCMWRAVHAPVVPIESGTRHLASIWARAHDVCRHDPRTCSRATAADVPATVAPSTLAQSVFSCACRFLSFSGTRACCSGSTRGAASASACAIASCKFSTRTNSSENCFRSLPSCACKLAISSTTAASADSSRTVAVLPCSVTEDGAGAKASVSPPKGMPLLPGSSKRERILAAADEITGFADGVRSGRLACDATRDTPPSKGLWRCVRAVESAGALVGTPPARAKLRCVAFRLAARPRVWRWMVVAAR